MSAVPRGERGASGARLAIVFVVVAAVLAGLFYAGDAYAHRRVEREVAATLQGELGTPTTPSVDIEGWPFLTQVVARRIGAVHVVADDVGQTGDAALPVAHVDLTLSDLTTTDWWKTMNAGGVEGTALVDHAALAQVAGVPLTYDGDGRYRVDVEPGAFGLTVKATVTGRLALDVGDQTVSLSDPRIQVAGYTMPDLVAEQLIDAVVKPVPLEGIPFQLQVSSVDARDDGLHVGLTGSDVPIRR